MVAMIYFGLLLLIASPAARAACFVVGFLRKRGLMYVWQTLIIFALLLYSLFNGKWPGQGMAPQKVIEVERSCFVTHAYQFRHLPESVNALQRDAFNYRYDANRFHPFR